MKIGGSKAFRRHRRKVFDSFADPARLDAVLGEQGANLRREGSGGPGTVWHLDVTSGGKARGMTIKLVDMEHPEAMRFQVTSEMVDADVAFVFTETSEDACTVDAGIDLAPRTLTARVALQTLRLARGRVEDRIQRALTALGRRD